MHKDHCKTNGRGLLPLIVGALGVVFGDIGTSPLYALKECFNSHYGLSLTPDNVLGILSVIFWTMIVVVGMKYMMFILEADNRGEGGILALMALSTMTERTSRTNRLILLPLGLFGASLLFGDGVITPAISVLSAIEGLKVATPVFEPYVIPLTISILIALFLVQRQGTNKIGAFFGPIITLWFLCLAILGVKGIMENPSVLWALSPVYAIHFFMSNGTEAFLVLGAVFLVVTGGEALYADMGHFGRTPIKWAWFSFVLPALALNYFGQGALLLNTPEAIENPFYLLAPPSWIYALVVLATMASVIASQALISGVFSLTRQAVQLGYLPRIKIIHTSSHEIGQIYVPFLNWIMLIGVVWLVIAFKTSSAMAAAYGIAVTITMAITTFLAFVVARRLWRWGWLSSSIFLILFLTIDILFLTACAFKFYDGGWVPIIIGVSVFTLMTTWQTGRRLLVGHLKSRSLSVEEFLKSIEEKPPLRVPGTAIYMTGDPWGVPIPLLHNIKHNKVMHECVVILTIATREVPSFRSNERVRVEHIAPNFHRIYAYYGFMETPRMREILNCCKVNGLDLDADSATFVLGRETIIPSPKPGMFLWREKIFALMSRNAQRPTAYFDIPVNQVIEVGIQVEI
ncbi:MAG: potassium transporter Kup [Bdellovibrionales bacterium]|nr:potassium transporter Kup [Bdellovibrionales bacterium]